MCDGVVDRCGKLGEVSGVDGDFGEVVGVVSACIEAERLRQLGGNSVNGERTTVDTGSGGEVGYDDFGLAVACGNLFYVD